MRLARRHEAPGFANRQAFVTTAGRSPDCAVLNLALSLLGGEEGDDVGYFQTVRGVFVEGDPVYDGARIHAKTHVQIAVRDPGCILGYFRPTASYTEG